MSFLNINCIVIYKMPITIDFCIDKGYYGEDLLKYRPAKFRKEVYNSFDELLKLENYNDIYKIDCHECNLTELPTLPKNLVELNCEHNKLAKLPELPSTLSSLTCCNNQLKYLPELPNKLSWLMCNSNQIEHLPVHFNNMMTLYGFHNNPIDNFVWDYFQDNRYARNIGRFHQWNKKTQKKFVRKIEDWYLDCKWNTKYKVCRDKIMEGYIEIYNENEKK